VYPAPLIASKGVRLSNTNLAKRLGSADGGAFHNADRIRRVANSDHAIRPTKPALSWVNQGPFQAPVAMFSD
jgi:hypothetical protein